MLMQVSCVLETLAYSSQKWIHPTSDNIPNVTNPDFILRPLNDVLTVGPDFYSSLAIIDTVIIGVDEGEPYEMLGNIFDIEVDVDGRIFILDREFGEVLFYDPDGSYLGSFGGPGVGPGEFTEPGELALSESGRIAVVFEERIHVFERQENGQFLYRNSFPAVGSRGCAMNDHIYVSDYHPGRPGNIQKFTMEGEWVASFGYTYRSESEFVTSVMSSGASARLACSERHGIIGMALSRIPILDGYSEDGELLWRIKFEDLKSSPIEEHNGGRKLIYKKSSKGDGVLAYFFTDADGEFFNITHFINAGRGKPTPWHYYRVDVRTGDGQYTGNARFLRATHRDYVIQSLEYPYPTLRVFHLDGN